MILAVLTLVGQAKQKFQCLYFQKPSTVPDTVQVYMNGKLLQEMPLQSHYFCDTIELKPAQEVVLTFTDKVVAEPEALAGYPSVSVSREWQSFVLLAFDDPKNTLLPIRFVPMNATAPQFKNGDIKFMNMTQYVVTGKLGAQTLDLPPRKVRTLNGFCKAGADFKVEVDIIKPESRKPRQALFYQGWRYNTEIRKLAFVYQKEGSKRVVYYVADIIGL